MISIIISEVFFLFQRVTLKLTGVYRTVSSLPSFSLTLKSPLGKKKKLPACLQCPRHSSMWSLEGSMDQVYRIVLWISMTHSDPPVLFFNWIHIHTTTLSWCYVVSKSTSFCCSCHSYWYRRQQRSLWDGHRKVSAVSMSKEARFFFLSPARIWAETVRLNTGAQIILRYLSSSE